MPKLTGASDAGAFSAAGYLVVNIMYRSEFLQVDGEDKDVGENSHCEGKSGWAASGEGTCLPGPSVYQMTISLASHVSSLFK